MYFPFLRVEERESGSGPFRQTFPPNEPRQKQRGFPKSASETEEQNMNTAVRTETGIVLRDRCQEENSTGVKLSMMSKGEGEKREGVQILKENTLNL